MILLTKRQIERQDRVDNLVFDLLQQFLPKKIDWDIELIGAMRDVICKEIVERKLITEVEFYP